MISYMISCSTRFQMDMWMGSTGLRFGVTVDGAPGRAPDDDAHPGRLQVVNHACRQPEQSNCWCVSELCSETFLSLKVLVTNQDVAADTAVSFPYQEAVMKGVPWGLPTPSLPLPMPS